MRRRLKRLREVKGMSQRMLAAKAKVTQGLIPQLEPGAIQDVRSRVVVNLPKALGVPVTELLA
jgi:predicted transcriptional regulator